MPELEPAKLGVGLSSDGTYQLLDEAADVGSGPPALLPDRLNGLYMVGVTGTATVRLEMSPDDGTTWIPVADTSTTESGAQVLDPCGGLYRANVTAHSSGSVSVWIRPYEKRA